MSTNNDPRVPADGLSLVRGPTDVALSDQTVHEVLAAAARRWPQRLRHSLWAIHTSAPGPRLSAGSRPVRSP